ncbi:alpha/beta hydrolase [Boudabousia marimammalium]|uniref:Esterase n=1 Tax=Boudabousia marimammalium TaxID=156892 RepID=A0A1Q5PRN7_9ACTO|nr:alpha/beta hydrolase-fold protein [Boudabousia marimammalium]OKL50254.1 hypothetical protein BM477_02355 [Boudabousia marimammalium]
MTVEQPDYLLGRPISLVGPNAITLTLVSLALVLVIATFLVRVKHRRMAPVWRAGGVLLSSSAMIVAMVIMVNAAMGFYPMLDSLFPKANKAVTEVKQLSPLQPPLTQNNEGREALKNEPQSAEVAPRNEPQWMPHFEQVEEANGAKLLQTKFTGPISQISQEVDVWVPREFSLDPNPPQPDYRVIIFLHGSPGNPFASQAALRAGEKLQAAIDQGKLPPTIMVFPGLNVDGQEPDCVNLVERPAVETWLAQELPTMLHSVFPQISAIRGDWNLTGVSAGGYCAVRTALLHPQVFGSTASLSGYNRPTVGLLSEAGVQLYNANTLSNLIGLPRKYPTRILFASSANDRDADFLTVSTNQISPLPGDEYANLPLTGGHNWGAWNEVLPNVLSWIGEQSEVPHLQPLGKGIGAEFEPSQPTVEGWWGIKSWVLISLVSILVLALGAGLVTRWTIPGRSVTADATNSPSFTLEVQTLRGRIIGYLLSLFLVTLTASLVALEAFLIFNANLEFYASWQDVIREFTVFLTFD